MQFSCQLSKQFAEMTSPVWSFNEWNEEETHEPKKKDDIARTNPFATRKSAKEFNIERSKHFAKKQELDKVSEVDFYCFGWSDFAR